MSTCPKCGYQNQQAAKFCQSCGTPLPTQAPSQPTALAPVPYYTIPPRRGMRSEEKVIIVAVLLIGILVVGTVAAVFVFYSPNSLVNRIFTRPAPVIVTGVLLHIQYPNSASSGYFGSATQPVNAPFFLYLQHNDQFRANFTLTLASSSPVPHSAYSLSIVPSPRFTLLLVNPSLPHGIVPGASAMFVVTCQAPSSDYTGPVTLNLVPS